MSSLIPYLRQMTRYMSDATEQSMTFTGDSDFNIFYWMEYKPS